MNDEIVQFVQKHMSQLNANDFEAIYKAAQTELSSETTKLLTKLLVESGVDVLSHMSFVPPYYAYESKDIKDVKIPLGITDIRPKAFGRSSITSVEFPVSLRIIRGSSFYRCENLSDVTLPNKLEVIGVDCFLGCLSLESISIPAKLKRIEENAFYSCSSLESIYINDLESWLKIYFANNYSNPMCNGADLYLNNKIVEEVTIPETITTIRSNAFAGCTSLKRVVIPKTVKKIEEDAFDTHTLEEVVYQGTKEELLRSNVFDIDSPYVAFTYYNQLTFKCTDGEFTYEELVR